MSMSLHSDEFSLQKPEVPLLHDHNALVFTLFTLMSSPCTNLRFPSSIMASELEFRHKPQTRQKETFLQTNFIYLPRFGTGKNDTRLLQKQREALLK